MRDNVVYGVRNEREGVGRMEGIRRRVFSSKITTLRHASKQSAINHNLFRLYHEIIKKCLSWSNNKILIISLFHPVSLIGEG